MPNDNMDVFLARPTKPRSAPRGAAATSKNTRLARPMPNLTSEQLRKQTHGWLLNFNEELSRDWQYLNICRQFYEKNKDRERAQEQYISTKLDDKLKNPENAKNESERFLKSILDLKCYSEINLEDLCAFPHGDIYDAKADTARIIRLAIEEPGKCSHIINNYTLLLANNFEIPVTVNAYEKYGKVTGRTAQEKLRLEVENYLYEFMQQLEPTNNLEAIEKKIDALRQEQEVKSKYRKGEKFVKAILSVKFLNQNLLNNPFGFTIACEYVRSITTKQLRDIAREISFKLFEIQQANNTNLYKRYIAKRKAELKASLKNGQKRVTDSPKRAGSQTKAEKKQKTKSAANGTAETSGTKKTRRRRHARHSATTGEKTEAPRSKKPSGGALHQTVQGGAKAVEGASEEAVRGARERFRTKTERIRVRRICW